MLVRSTEDVLFNSSDPSLTFPANEQRCSHIPSLYRADLAWNPLNVDRLLFVLSAHT